MIVEYLGIPGSGKTYSLAAYKKQLEINEASFIDISRHKGMPIWMKMLYKFADYIIHILPRYRRQISLYKNVCIGCNSQPVYMRLTLDYCIEDIVLASFLHNIFAKSRKIILNDEGQLQRIVTLIVLYNAPLEEIMTIYRNEKHVEETIFVDIPIEKAYSNIKKRNRHVCEMDELDENALYRYLDSFDNICRKVYSMTKSA